MTFDENAYKRIHYKHTCHLTQLRQIHTHKFYKYICRNAIRHILTILNGNLRCCLRFNCRILPEQMSALLNVWSKLVVSVRFPIALSYGIWFGWILTALGVSFSINQFRRFCIAINFHDVGLYCVGPFGMCSHHSLAAHLISDIAF